MPTMKELRQKFDVVVLMRTDNLTYDTVVEFHKNDDVVVVDDVRSLSEDAPCNAVIDKFMDTWSLEDTSW